MTRGKYAARAKRTREDAEVRSEVDSYQHHIRRLQAENTELKARLAALTEASRQEGRALRAQLAEGLTPELITLREELVEAKRKAEKAKRDAIKARQHGYATTRRLHKLLHLLGFSGTEAIEVIMGDDRLLIPEPSVQRLGRDRALKVDSAKGLRSVTRQELKERLSRALDEGGTGIDAVEASYSEDHAPEPLC